MNKKIIIAVLLVAGIFTIPSIVSSYETFDNADITNIRAIQKGLYELVDDGMTTSNESRIPYIIDVNYYVNVTGDPTSTYTIYQFRELVDTKLNINSLNNVNKTIKNTIKDYAKTKWNYTISDSKILIQPFVKGNDI